MQVLRVRFLNLTGTSADKKTMSYGSEGLDDGFEYVVGRKLNDVGEEEEEEEEEEVCDEKKISSQVDSLAEETDLRKLGTDMNYKFTQRHLSRHWFLAFLHLFAIFGLYYCFYGAKFATVIWAAVLALLNNQAVVLLAHRAYSHRSFKVTKSLQIALIFFQTMAGQSSIFWWARDHRVHHKYTDTDADPYNATRGFYFAHMGWLLVEKHPAVTEKSKLIDISDLRADYLIMWQHKYFLNIYFFVGFLFPWLTPYYLWNENPWIAFCVAYCLRYVIALHTIFTINSFGHMYGTRPFDKRINPVQSKIVHWSTGGDGWHNFHHCFPWDYGLSEFGYGKGLATLAIEFFARHGYVYDLKKSSIKVVGAHAARHGDRSHKFD